MRNFYQVATGIDVTPIQAALVAHPELWNANDLRTTFPGSPHAAVDDIWLMFDDPDGDVVDSIQTHPFLGWSLLPVRDLVLNLMRRVNGTQLGRVIITRLPPGKTIPQHTDQGAPAEFFQRYQIALQCLPGAIMTIGEEVIQFSPGEAWWINNRAPHSVVNNSADDRIVIIADIRIC